MKLRAILVTLAVLAGIGIFTWAILNTHGDATSAQESARIARETAAQVREGQIEACHEVGDPLLRGEIALWRDEYNSTKGIKASDFPGFSPAEFHRLVRKQRRGAQHHIEKLRTAPSCEERF